MDWIDEDRRNAFERIRPTNRSDPSKGGPFVSELDVRLPNDVKKRALPFGNEFILPYEDALVTIATASEHRIAVLGFDSGEVTDDGFFQSLGYTDYDRDIEFTGDWNAYVAAINTGAERWIKGHRLGKNCGYILTSTSQGDFAQLKR